LARQFIRCHIRLLKLFRRIPLSGLRCQLIHVRISEAPAYEAISYCWGNAPPTKTVIVNGRPMEVLDSVYEVLHYRHSFRQARLLWIDSVCINQDNELEKEEQIQLMRTIFSRAISVIAWLGDMEHAFVARDFLHTLHAKNGIFGQTTEQLFNEYNHSVDIGWKNLGILFSKSWFTRIWIVQEIALAKNIQLVFGDASIDWEKFAGVLPLICDPLLTRFLGSPDAEYGMIRPSIGASNALIMAYCRNRVQEWLHVTLDETLSFTIAFESTKGHDKIYAVLGLTDQRAGKIKPDYRKSVEKVFIETVRYLLKTTYPPSTFHLAGIGTERKHQCLPGFRTGPCLTTVLWQREMRPHIKPVQSTPGECSFPRKKMLHLSRLQVM
jgi:hypothetical protein